MDRDQRLRVHAVVYRDWVAKHMGEPGDEDEREARIQWRYQVGAANLRPCLCPDSSMA
jgi:hypothetical protein